MDLRKEIVPLPLKGEGGEDVVKAWQKCLPHSSGPETRLEKDRY